MKKYVLSQDTLYAMSLFAGWVAITLLQIKEAPAILKFVVWIVLLLIGVLGNPKVQLYIRNAGGIWYLFVCCTFFSTLLNIALGTANNYGKSARFLGSIVQYLLPLTAVYLLTRYHVKDRFIIYFRTFILICCVFGVFEYIFKFQVYEGLITAENALYNFNYYGSTALPAYRITLIFYHPIYYSILLAICCGCMLYRPFRNTAVQIISILLILFNLIFTKSRSGWVALGVIIIIYVLKKGKIKYSRKAILSVLKSCVFIILIAVLVVFIRKDLFASIWKIFEERLFGITLNNAAGARFAHLSLISAIFSDPQYMHIWLFGGGNNFAISYLQEHPVLNNWTRAIDNQYMTNLLDYGLFGVAFFLLFLFMIIKRLFKSTEDESFVLSVVLSIMAASLFFDSYGSNTVNYLLFIFVGLLNSRKNTC